MLRVSEGPSAPASEAPEIAERDELRGDDGFRGFEVRKPLSRGQAAASWYSSTFGMFRAAIEQILRFVPYGIYTPTSQLPEHELEGKPRPNPSFLTKAFNGLTTAIAAVAAAPLTLLATPVALTAGLIGKVDGNKWMPSEETVARHVGDYRVRKWMVRVGLVLGLIATLALAIPAIIGGAAAGLGFATTMQMVGATLGAGFGYILQAMGIGAFLGLTTRLDGFWRRRKVPALEKEAIEEALLNEDREHREQVLGLRSEQDNVVDSDATYTAAFKQNVQELREDVEAAQLAYDEARASGYKGWIFNWPIKARMDAAKALADAKARLEDVERYGRLMQYEVPTDGAQGKVFFYRSPVSVAARIREINELLENAQADLKAVKENAELEPATKKEQIAQIKEAMAVLKAEKSDLKAALDIAINYTIDHPNDADKLNRMFGLRAPQTEVIRRTHEAALRAHRTETPVVQAVDGQAAVTAAHNREWLRAMSQRVQDLSERVGEEGHEVRADRVQGLLAQVAEMQAAMGRGHDDAAVAGLQRRLTEIEAQLAALTAVIAESSEEEPPVSEESAPVSEESAPVSEEAAPVSEEAPRVETPAQELEAEEETVERVLSVRNRAVTTRSAELLSETDHSSAMMKKMLLEVNQKAARSQAATGMQAIFMANENRTVDIVARRGFAGVIFSTTINQGERLCLKYAEGDNYYLQLNEQGRLLGGKTVDAMKEISFAPKAMSTGVEVLGDVQVTVTKNICKPVNRMIDAKNHSVELDQAVAEAARQAKGAARTPRERAASHAFVEAKEARTRAYVPSQKTHNLLRRARLARDEAKIRELEGEISDARVMRLVK